MQLIQAIQAIFMHRLKLSCNALHTHIRVHVYFSAPAHGSTVFTPRAVEYNCIGGCLMHTFYLQISAVVAKKFFVMKKMK